MSSKMLRASEWAYQELSRRAGESRRTLTAELDEALGRPSVARRLAANAARARVYVPPAEPVKDLRYEPEDA